MVDFGLLIGETAQSVGSGISDLAKMSMEDKKKIAAEKRAEAREWARLRATQEFQAGENALGREHQSGENALGREHQSGENALSREHQSSESALSREHQDKWNQKNYDLDVKGHDLRAAIADRAEKTASTEASTLEQKQRFEAWKELNDVVSQHYDAIELLDKEIANAVTDEAAEDLRSKRVERMNELRRAEKMANSSAPDYVRRLQQEEENRHVIDAYGLSLDAINQIRQGYNNDGIQQIVSLYASGEAEAEKIYAASKVLNPELYRQLEYQIGPARERRKGFEQQAGQPVSAAQPESSVQPVPSQEKVPAAAPQAQGLMTDTVAPPPEKRGLLDQAPVREEAPEVTAPSRGTETNNAAATADAILQDIPRMLGNAVKSVKDFFKNPDDMQSMIREYEKQLQSVGDPPTRRLIEQKIATLQKQINETLAK